jgi:dTDP-4-dehydrorhamnose 3,5-epimerase
MNKSNDQQVKVNISYVTEKWLKSQKFQLHNIYQPPTIDGVILKELNPIPDGRGDLIELWSKSWVKKEGMVVPTHVYQSGTDYGVVKCWHLDSVHTDQMTVTRGKIQIVLADVRKGSSTLGHVNSIFMSFEKPRLLKIPPGIMHGWKCLSTPEVIVVNLQSHVYDPEDEVKIRWNCVLEDVWEPKNA